MAAVSIQERKLLQLLRDHLQQTGQVESMWSLERSTGVQPVGLLPEEKTLRKLVSQGLWEDVGSSLLRLKDKEGYSHCKFLLHRQRLLELLFSRPESLPLYGTKVRNAMRLLQQSCPTKKQFTALSYLLTLPRLQADPDYKEWTPSNSRLELFRVLANFLRNHAYPRASLVPSAPTTGGSSRLDQLVIKGLLYEKCEEVFRTQQGEREDGSANAMDLCQWLQQQPDSMFLAQPPCVCLAGARQLDPTKAHGYTRYKSLAYLNLDTCRERKEKGFVPRARSVPSNLHLCPQASDKQATLAALTVAATPPPCLRPPGGVASSTPKLKTTAFHTEVKFQLVNCVPEIIVSVFIGSV